MNDPCSKLSENYQIKDLGDRGPTPEEPDILKVEFFGVTDLSDV